MKTKTLLFLGVLVAQAFAAGAALNPDSVDMVRFGSPYMREEEVTHLRLEDVASIKALILIVNQAKTDEDIKPRCPLLRVEFISAGKELRDQDVIDFMGYRGGDDVQFYHAGTRRSVSVVKLKDWCAAAKITFDDYFVTKSGQKDC